MPPPKKDIPYLMLAETVHESSISIVPQMPEPRDADVERRFLRIIEDLEGAEQAETHYAEYVIVRGILRTFNDLKSMVEEQGIGLGSLEEAEATLRGCFKIIKPMFSMGYLFQI
jgi:hypothetical protein